MVLLASFFGIVHDLPGLTSIMNGVVSAVVGLLAATTFRLGRANVNGLLPLVIAVAAFAAAVGLQAHAALVVLLAGLLGLLTLTPPSPKPEAKAGGG